MKVVFMSKLPKCDFCGAEASYDAPTVSGAWANMCEECFPKNRPKNRSMTSSFFYSIKKNGTTWAFQPSVKPKITIKSDEVIAECPKCGTKTTVETDADTCRCGCCGQLMEWEPLI